MRHHACSPNREAGKEAELDRSIRRSLASSRLLHNAVKAARTSRARMKTTEPGSPVHLPTLPSWHKPRWRDLPATYTILRLSAADQRFERQPASFAASSPSKTALDERRPFRLLSIGHKEGDKHGLWGKMSAVMSRYKRVLDGQVIGSFALAAVEMMRRQGGRRLK
jgi:hypothetical protein